jgi:hypothetical protein
LLPWADGKRCDRLTDVIAGIPSFAALSFARYAVNPKVVDIWMWKSDEVFCFLSCAIVICFLY